MSSGLEKKEKEKDPYYEDSDEEDRAQIFVLQRGESFRIMDWSTEGLICLLCIFSKYVHLYLFKTYRATRTLVEQARCPKRPRRPSRSERL